MFAFAAVLLLRGTLTTTRGPLSKVGFGPTGVTLEFAEAKLSEAAARSGGDVSSMVGNAARRSIIDRLQRNDDLLSRARILWTDDHPENNLPMVELLTRFGATVDTPQSNARAVDLISATRYDVAISDVARDDEGRGSGLKGVELAETLFSNWGLRTILFTSRFNPATYPELTAEQRLELVERLRRSTFAVTNRVDELLHYTLDVLERRTP